MPTDRLFKFSIPGLMFLLISVFFYDLLGGELNKILQWTKDLNLIPLLGLIISTPIIGVVLSTIALWFLQLKWGYEIMYYPPTNPKIVKFVLKDNPTLEKKIISNDIVIWDCETHKKEFYPFYQAKLRELLNTEQINFLDRRWSSYWTHVNNISVTVFSFLIVGGLRLVDIYRCGYCIELDLAIYKIIGLVLVLLYCKAGYVILKTSKQSATDTEHIMLANAIDKSEKEKNKDDKKNLPTWTSLLNQLLELIK